MKGITNSQSPYKATINLNGKKYYAESDGELMLWLNIIEKMSSDMTKDRAMYIYRFASIWFKEWNVDKCRIKINNGNGELTIGKY